MSDEKESGSRIDWRGIHRRLELAANASGEAGPETRRRILKSRAKSLARESGNGAGEEPKLEVVEFLLAYERYAFEIESVREVYPLKEFTRVPGAPPFVMGIVNVRGRIISVVDLKNFFELPTRGLPDLNRVIIIGNRDMEFGILADSVTGVRQADASRLETGLPTLTGIRAEYLKGVTADRVAVLDAVKLLEDKRLHVSQLTDP